MKRILSSALAAAAASVLAAPATAQTFALYQCSDGTQFEAAFYDGSVALQLDGKSLLLPRRLAVSGARYAKSGVTLSIKGLAVTLKRGRYKVDCSAS